MYTIGQQKEYSTTESVQRPIALKPTVWASVSTNNSRWLLLHMATAQSGMTVKVKAFWHQWKWIFTVLPQNWISTLLSVCKVSFPTDPSSGACRPTPWTLSQLLMTWSESGGRRRDLQWASVARLPQLLLNTLYRQRGDHDPMWAWTMVLTLASLFNWD